jgi:hypothetical protein
MLPWAFDSFQGCGALVRVLWAASGSEELAAVPLPVGWPPRGLPSGWRLPLPFQWPPRGSLSGRWRCPWLGRCLSAGPRGGRLLGCGRCRCLSAGPRRGRRLGGGAAACLLAPERVGVWAVASGQSRSVAVLLLWLRWGSEELRWGRGGLRGAARWLRWGSEELRWGRTAAPMPPNPVRVRLAAPPRGVGLSVPWAASPRPRGGLVCRSGEGPPAALPRRRGGVGPGGARLAGVASPKRGGGAGCLCGSAPPRGVGLTSAPGGVSSRLGQAPFGPVGRRASSFRGRASACIAGVIPLAWRVLGCSAEAVRPSSRLLRKRRGAGGASAGPRLLRWRRSAVGASAEAPPWAVRAPEGGWAARVRLVCRGPSGPRAFWTPALPKRGRADTPGSPR